MNFIFSSYPEHPWFQDWTLEARNCTATFRQDNPEQFFRTTETVGRIVPNVFNPEWALQIPVPQNSRINMLFNGFCSYLTRKKERYGGELLIPEPGIIWGRYDGIPEPVIASEHPIDTSDGYHWIESDTAPALLIIHATTFCLVSRCKLKKDALELANHYLHRDFDEALLQELESRNGAKSLFEEMDHHDSLAVICTESMLKALRPPEGSIPLRWCQSSETDSPELNINELYPLALAWKRIDIETAEELITCALKIQTNAGAIPVHFSPHTTHSVLEAPKPLIIKTAEEVWDVRKDDDLLTSLLPPLRRHLQWMLHHFDPKRGGLHSWKNSSEPIVPETYETDKATADLTVLLLTEIEAFNRMRRSSSAFGSEADAFEQEHMILKQNLLDQFWNEDSSSFSNAVHRDRIIEQRGFSAFAPLLWDGLPNRQRTAILEKVKESGVLPGGHSILSWRNTSLDDKHFPILLQMLIFESLITAEPHGQILSDFSRVTLQEFVEWHTLTLEKGKTLPIHTALAAFIMNIQSIRQYRYHAKGGVSGWASKLLKKAKIDSFELVVALTTLFILFCVRMFYTSLNAPPQLEILEAEMNTAYVNQNVEETLLNSRMIIQHYPDSADMARLFAANISMMSLHFLDATALLEAIREKHPDSPGAMISLGLAYQLQGRFQEADKIYYEFCYIFEEIFPEIVEKVSQFRYLADEGFRTPPKWQNIYRYQLMHEL